MTNIRKSSSFQRLNIPFTLENFKFFWQSVKVKTYTIDPIGKYFFNTIWFSLIVTALQLVVSVTAAYAISRLNFKGKKVFLNSLFILDAFPVVSLLISIYYVLSFLSIIDSMFGAIIVKVALGAPMSGYMLKGFLDDNSVGCGVVRYGGRLHAVWQPAQKNAMVPKRTCVTNAWINMAAARFPTRFFCAEHAQGFSACCRLRYPHVQYGQNLCLLLWCEKTKLFPIVATPTAVQLLAYYESPAPQKDNGSHSYHSLCIRFRCGVSLNNASEWMEVCCQHPSV